MRQSLNFFSKLFSSSNPHDTSPDHSKQISHLRSLFEPEGAEFYRDLPIFNQHNRYTLPFVMLHPSAGVILFSFFDHDGPSLRDVKAQLADRNQAPKADIQTDDAKAIIQQRFDDIYHTQLCPVRSILICPNLSEGEFDYLDESFHQLIPKNSVIFNDHTDKRYKEILIPESSPVCDISKIKHALFAELSIPDNNNLMTPEQAKIIHLPLQQDLLIQGVPGCGKSSILVAKALYEKMKDPELSLILFTKHTCHVHHLQSLLFSFIEHAHWALNPADITVSSIETLGKRVREKEKYDLIISDDISEATLKALIPLKHKNATLICSSYYPINSLTTHKLSHSFRLAPAIEAACEGLEVETLQNNLQLKQGNLFMNTLVNLETLMKKEPASSITLVVQDSQFIPQIKTEIDEYFGPISYLFDHVDKDKGIVIYPISHLSCITSEYLIAIVEDIEGYDLIELISRASKKSFILSESEAIYNIISTIKGLHNASD